MANFAKISLLLPLLVSLVVAANHCNCGHGGRNQGNHTLPAPAPRRGAGVGVNIGNIVSSSLFDQLLDKNKLGLGCAGGSFYTHDAFTAAAKAYPAFGCTGSEEDRKKEVAAFFAQTSAQTSGGGLLPSGYCLVESTDKSQHCQASASWPCAPGKSYHGRGPMQLTWNYNYGACGRAVGFDGIANPDLVAKDPVVAFKTALWFWMTPQGNMPSCHDVILGVWKPSGADVAAGRATASFGTVTNIINGGHECGKGPNARAKARIAFYERCGNALGITTGSNVDCYKQKPWN